ncbi:hypothetical protein [Polyangium sorediatum]|uniref:Uncharacterized protein n=1 Tax=Polyangium sorediatum TaxID=889274 RepID=A0ABT6P9H7_9BACT|nr:hypothetical protein [Polyangium sorediatum]MDI1437276.1 hypothetical protein [Polyangium sorediatum]
METYASIKARLWGAPASSAARILGEHGLTEVDWLLHEQRYADAIGEELHQEQAPLERAVREAILKAETPRPEDIPDLTIEEFVALRLACETAADPAVELSARGLTASAFRRLRSHWRLQSLADPGIAADLRARLAAGRTHAVL